VSLGTSSGTGALVEAARGMRSGAESRRLWASLSRPARRRLPLEGFDAAAARMRGVASRRRSGRADRARAERIVSLADELAGASERALNDRVARAREAAILERDDPATINDAFAVAHEVVRREIGLRLYVEQVMGALAMASGACTEMATGEGKTVTAILPAALDAWSGRGVHVLTVNDYLAGRDAEITGPAYRRLGLRVGVINEESKTKHRRSAYARDVTYAADKQVIFDFLRDRLISPIQPRLTGLVLEQVLGGDAQERARREASWDQRVVQRGLHAAIVDEADSVLIDEAVTPAIISLPLPEAERAADANATHYHIATRLAAQMREPEHYLVDRRLRRVRLTERGRAWLGEQAAALPAFWAGPNRREELMTLALSAKELYVRGEDYVVRDGKVVIVDRSTGRMLEGRQWQLGVHQGVEAKEGLEVSADRRTSARISYQRFFQRYRRLSGMSGTVWEVADELWRDYDLPVVRVPTHRPVIREHRRDRVHATERRKLDAIARRIEALHEAGRPVLIGSRSVTSSEQLGRRLGERGIDCRILNATREREEAEIIAQAGRRGAVTVATNMAGRGTDIKLDEEARSLGGLVVLSTERNDERRVDRQFSGRAGRQGDPGLAEAHVLLEDRLIAQHGLGPLVWLTRASRGWARRALARVLWALAQRSASRRLAVMRAEAAKLDAQLDVAMHHESR